jgi:hypothetical protein
MGNVSTMASTPVPPVIPDPSAAPTSSSTTTDKKDDVKAAATDAKDGKTEDKKEENKKDEIAAALEDLYDNDDSDVMPPTQTIDVQATSTEAKSGSSYVARAEEQQVSFRSLFLLWTMTLMNVADVIIVVVS